MGGVVRAIFVRATGNGPPESLDRAEVSVDGVEGDRYVNGTGTFFRGTDPLLAQEPGRTPILRGLR